MVGRLRAKKLPICEQSCNTILLPRKTCHLKFRSILCVFHLDRAKLFLLNDTPELVYCRASEPESYRCGYHVYVPCSTLKEITDSLYRPANLIAALNQLVDALTGLERILTTPIPYSSVPLCSRNRRKLMAASQIFGSPLDCDHCLLLLFGRLTWTSADLVCLLICVPSLSSFGRR